MPIYEEKLICPLTVRYSQDHIRPEFQDRKGSDLDTSIKAIKTKPGHGDYDLVLVPPFPAIEIIRGHFRNGDADHWLSLDNRRLYCLQQAAVAHWPLRVAVVVEALRAPTEGMRKKVNSSVEGLSVGIGHSPKALTSCWDWQEKVKDLSIKSTEATTEDAVRRLIALEDAKASIQDLSEAEAPPSMLDLFFQNELLKTGDPSDTSTTEPRSPRGSEGSNDSSLLNVICGHNAAGSGNSDWMPDLSGVWEDDKGNSYSVSIAEESSFTCWRKNSTGGKRKFMLWYDEGSDSLSWGDDWSLWADASEIRKGSNGCVMWYAGRDSAKRKPRFQWSRVNNEGALIKQSRRPKGSKKMNG
jgi:hypothetical protein